jgi:hypothetical protein
MKPITIILSCAIVILAGCSTSQAATPQTPSATNAAENVPAETSQEVQIMLRKTGGFAGVDESWTVTPDGRITTSDGRTGQVGAAELSNAVAELEKLGFFKMQASYMPKDTCCDRFTYQLDVTVNGMPHSVTVLEAAPETPAEFWQALETVNSLLASVK